MSQGKRFRYTDDSGQVRLQIGEHTGIGTPFYAPELKNWVNDLHITLDQRHALEKNNPILVPGWDWQDLCEVSSIQDRENSNGQKTGLKEVESLEDGHPLIHWFPPELFAFSGLVDTLRTHLLKRNHSVAKQFKENMVAGEVEAALELVPAFTQPFFRTNLEKFGAKWNSDLQYDPEIVVESDEEAWKELREPEYETFFSEMVRRASETPSWVIIPPVPLLREYDSDLVTSLCMANSKMAEIAQSENEPRGYFHLYLHYSSFNDSVDENTAEKLQGVVESEIDRGEYAGIALTVHKAEKSFEVSNEFRIGTFLENISRIAENNNIPVISPRSEWFGLFATDFGIDGFSSLYNGQWRYSDSASSGGPTGADKYGKAMVKGESKAVKLRDSDNDDVEDYLTSGSFPAKSGLPNTPPSPPADAIPSNPDALQEKYGKSIFYRRHFGKPQRLNHIWEAQEARRRRQNGESRPARQIIEDAHRYIEFDNQDN